MPALDDELFAVAAGRIQQLQPAVAQQNPVDDAALPGLPGDDELGGTRNASSIVLKSRISPAATDVCLWTRLPSINR
jgi:hypothetical protein